MIYLKYRDDMKKKVQITILLFLFLFFTGWISLIFFRGEQLDRGRSDYILAETEKDNRLKKIIERIRKAGLHPREAKYYRVVEE
jgi:hypothetical protein